MSCKLMIGSIYAFKAGPQILGDLTGGLISPAVVSGGQFLFLILLTGNLQISDLAMTVNIGLHCLANGSAKTHYFKYGPILLSSE